MTIRSRGRLAKLHREVGKVCTNRLDISTGLDLCANLLYWKIETLFYFTQCTPKHYKLQTKHCKHYKLHTKHCTLHTTYFTLLTARCTRGRIRSRMFIETTDVKIIHTIEDTSNEEDHQVYNYISNPSYNRLHEQVTT